MDINEALRQERIAGYGDRLESQVNALKDELEQAYRQINSLRDDLHDARAALKEADKEIERLHEQLDSLKWDALGDDL